MDLIDRQAAIDAMGKAKWAKERLMELPSAQPEQSDDADFWRKRADYYYNVSVKLIDKIQDGAKCDSVTIDENGITYKLQAPDKCDRCRFTFFEKGEDDDGQ